MKISKTKKQALEHYDRMITLMEITQEYDLYNELIDYGVSIYLQKYLGETYGAEDCSYCRKYVPKYCECDAYYECPLYTDNGCCNGLHRGMIYNSGNVSVWIEVAKRVRQYIEENG
jgi:hypothetical protein